MRLVIAVIACLLIGSDGTKTSGVPKCTESQLETLWPNMGDPTAFYKCNKIGQRSDLRCDNGDQFSFVDQKCVNLWDWESRVIVQNDEEVIEAGYILQETPLEAVDDVDGSGEGTEEPAPAPQTPKPACSADQLETLWPNYDDARGFFQCTGLGRYASMPCAPGTLFSFEQQVCVHPADWVSPTLPPSTTALPTTAYPATPACSANQLGTLWPNYEDRTQFYQCAGVGKIVTKQCPAGTVFNFIIQNCAWP